MVRTTNAVTCAPSFRNNNHRNQKFANLPAASYIALRSNAGRRLVINGESSMIRDNARGIDCDRQLLPGAISRLVSDGFEFAMRYLSRAALANPNDLRGIEAETIRRMGMAVGFVQHVPPHVWYPNEITARADGVAAVRQLRAIGVPAGKTVWFDLESVDASADHNRLVTHINTWDEVVSDSGYQTGAYVGAGCLLLPKALYYDLAVTRYWSAYNLDLDRYPAVRGVCMHQHSAQPSRPWADINTVNFDAFNCLPSFWETDE